PVPEHLLVELADAGLGYLGDQRPPFRQLPSGYPSGEELAELVEAGRGDHCRKWTLAPVLVRYADHARLDDRRMGHQTVLQLDRGDPLPAGLDDVLGAVGQREVTVGGDRADVTGT